MAMKMFESKFVSNPVALCFVQKCCESATPLCGSFFGSQLFFLSSLSTRFLLFFPVENRRKSTLSWICLSQR